MPVELHDRTASAPDESTVDSQARVRRRRRFIVGGLAAAWVVAMLAAAPFYRLYDLQIYHSAIADWFAGENLYSFYQANNKLGFTYPPFGAIALAPITAWPMWLSGPLSVLAGAFALMACVYFIVAPYAAKRGWHLPTVVLAAGLAAVVLEPMRQTLGYGQINLVLAALVLADMAGLRTGHRLTGLGIGVATAIKLTPALFIVYLLVVRRWRAALTATGTTIACWGVAFLVAPESSATYWGGVFWNSARVGQDDFTPNQSLAGFLARLYDRNDTPLLLWLSFGLLLLVLGLSRAAAASRAGDELAAFALVGMTANIVSPISWSHHLVWVLPALAALILTAIRRGSTWLFAAAGGVYALFASAPIWWVDPYSHSHWDGGVARVLFENSFAIALIVLVASLPHVVTRHAREGYPGRRSLAA